MTFDEIRRLLDSRATVRLWPEAGEVLGLKRGQTYRCASTGEISTLDFGRVKRVSTEWLRQKLGIPRGAQVATLSPAEHLAGVQETGLQQAHKQVAPGARARPDTEPVTQAREASRKAR